MLKLSDAFESGLLPDIKKETPALELEVKVININQGRNKEIADKCKTLGEYSAFIDRVRGFEKETDNLEEAVKKAVIYCRDHDILKEFLEKNATEVLSMLMTEWNLDDAKKVWYEDGLEDGREECRQEERQYFLSMLDQGLTVEEIKQRLANEAH